MSESRAVEFVEDRVPGENIEETISELVELYGGEVKSEQANERRVVLPLRRGVAVAGAIECTLSWTSQSPDEASVTMICHREVDAPRWQRIALLLAGVTGALLFMIWPFFLPRAQELGTLAALGGITALSVYFLTLRKTSAGLAYDFLQRLARRQRERRMEAERPA